jgi:hypothetical protein
MAIAERDFFQERNELKTATFTCPRCGHRAEYQVRWVRRTKKDRIPHGADERDRALYGKLRDHLFRVDDDLTCARCRRRFEIPSHQTLVFI